MTKTKTTNSTLKAKPGGYRVHQPIYLGVARHRALHELADRYSKLVGRPVSLALVMCRALDVLSERLDGDLFNDPKEIMAERLTILGPTRTDPE